MIGFLHGILTNQSKSDNSKPDHNPVIQFDNRIIEINFKNVKDKKEVFYQNRKNMNYTVNPDIL